MTVGVRVGRPGLHGIRPVSDAAALSFPKNSVYQVVGDADHVIRRRDGRVEYFRDWEGRSLLVVAEGDIEDHEEILILNVIEDVRRRR